VTHRHAGGHRASDSPDSVRWFLFPPGTFALAHAMAAAMQLAPRARAADIEIDCATEPRIAEALDDLRNVGWDAIVLDIEAVSCIDSTGLRLFLTTDARARREGWRFELHGSCASFERLLSLTGLHDWFRRT
jgi:anti-anti-sigma factor